MKKPAIIYSLMVFAVAAAFLCLLWAYIVKFPFDIPPPVNGRQALSKTFEDGKMLVETTVDNINAEILRFCAEGSLLPAGLEAMGAAVVFGENAPPASNELYINIKDNNLFGGVFSFKCAWSLEYGEAVVARFSDKRLGTLEIPLLGDFFWWLLKLPDYVEMPEERRLQRLSNVSVSPAGAVVLTYDYLPEELAKALSDALSHSDERKIDFHRGKLGDNLIKAAETRIVTADEAMALIMEFEKTPETFRGLCYLLNETGINKLYEDFGESYYRHISAGKLFEASEGELDAGLNQFNSTLSRLLLQYLYINRDYTVKDGSLYVYGNKTTADTVLSAKPEYDISIFADGESIKAIYNVAGKLTEKTILSQRGE